jgi:hypothetical protein
MTMKKPSMIPMPGEGWLSRSAAQTAYRLSNKEIDLICRELRPTGAYCARKGLAIGALDQVVQRLRSQS